MRRIEIRAGNVRVMGELNDTLTADAIWRALPFSAEGNTWGDEIYFSIPVQLGAENARAVVNLGDLGYWPPGTAFCIFFGRTPVSKGEEIRPASPVNVFGCISGDLKALRQVKDGETLTILRAQES
jgi:hypothetical protein